jgi:Uma2 family endonuclease
MNLKSPRLPLVLPRLEAKTWDGVAGRITRPETRETPGVADPEVFDFDLDHLVTEDDEPVDNLPSAKQQRLLVESLYSSWAGPPDGPFLADANVGIFTTARATPLVPDVFLSLNVQVAEDWWQKQHRSYLLSEFHKPPEVVVEIVSNRKGDEDERKLQDYARLGIRYYLIFDPTEQLKQGVLRIYELQHQQYVKLTTHWLAAVGLGVTLWTGTYEKKKDTWLRWCDAAGNLILTGAERATQERHEKELVRLQLIQEQQRAEQEQQRAEQEQQRAEQEQQRAEQERQRADLERHAKEQERQRADLERQAKEVILSQLAHERQRAEQERQQKEHFLAQLRALGIEPTM